MTWYGPSKLKKVDFFPPEIELLTTVIKHSISGLVWYKPHLPTLFGYKVMNILCSPIFACICLFSYAFCCFYSLFLPVPNFHISRLWRKLTWRQHYRDSWCIPQHWHHEATSVTGYWASIHAVFLVFPTDTRVGTAWRRQRWHLKIERVK